MSLIRYRYRDSITKEIKYVESVTVPSSNITANTLTIIKYLSGAGAGGTGASINVNLIDNQYATIMNPQLGSYKINVKKLIPMEGAPTGEFTVSKVMTNEIALVHEMMNIKSDNVNPLLQEKIEIIWLANNVMQIRKVNSLSTVDNTYDGVYVVNII